MDNRLKQLRKKLGLTQQEFADKLGIARGNVSAYEVGKNAPSDAVIALICREFNVSENWLRTGEGEIFIKMSRSEEIAKLTAELFKEKEESFKSRFIMSLTALDETEWKVLEKIFNMTLSNE